jgi:hypothetical protein
VSRATLICGRLRDRSSRRKVLGGGRLDWENDPDTDLACIAHSQYLNPTAFVSRQAGFFRPVTIHSAPWRIFSLTMESFFKNSARLFTNSVNPQTTQPAL